LLWLVRALAEGVVGVDESESSSSSASFSSCASVRFRLVSFLVSFSPAPDAFAACSARPWSDDLLIDFLLVDLALESFARGAR